MQIKCDREELLSGFQIASMVTPVRSPKATLQTVKLEANTDSSVLMATDMDIGIRVEIAGIEVTGPGSCLLPVERFGPILRESTDDKLSIQTSENEILVEGERSSFHLPAINVDEFPPVGGFEENSFHEISARLLRELIRRTLFATDTESSRYALGGVLFQFETDKIIAVGTDGRRLAKMEGPALEVQEHAASETMSIIPARSLQLIERSISDSDGEIQIASRNNDLIIKSPRTVISSRLVEGRFPRWREVFPAKLDGATIQLAVGPIFSALRQAAIVTDSESRGIDFVFADGNLRLAGSTAEIGQSQVELPIPYEGPEIKITLDHRFVSDFLKVLDPEKTFTVELKDNETAALFSTDDGYEYVVMPLSRER